MKTALIYIAVAFALAAGITATLVFEPQAAFACDTGDCSN
jgi:Na+/H+-dicarboxylate symporter